MMDLFKPVLLVFLAVKGLDCVCPVVTSLDSALIHLDLVQDGYFKLNTADNTRAKKMDLLKSELSRRTGDASRVNGLSEDELVELGAMFAFFHFEGSWDNVHGWSFNDLRAVLMDKAVSTKPELESIAWSMTTRDLVSVACNQEIYFTEKMNEGEAGGCAHQNWLDGPTSQDGKVTALSATSANQAGCLNLCRDAGFTYYMDKGYSKLELPSWPLAQCECSSAPHLVDSGSTSCTPDKYVRMTGTGYPTLGFRQYPDKNILLDVDGLDIPNNPLLGIKEVVYPGAGADKSYFVAVHHFCISLYEISFSSSGRATAVKYIQHFRWDGANVENANVKEDAKTNWIYDWNQGDSGSRDPATNPPTGTTAAMLEAATSFVLVPVFVSLNESMVTQEEIKSDNIGDVENLAGLPVRGGKWQQNLFIFHAGTILSVPGLQKYVKVTTLAITGEGMHHLRTVSSFLEDGAFFLTSPPSKNVAASAARTIGRKSYFIAGSSNDVIKQGKIEIFKLTEKKKPLSAHAAYGQLVAKPTYSLQAKNILSISVGGFLDAHVLVLEGDYDGSESSNLKVYKMTNDEDLILLSEKVFDVRYVSVKYSRFRGEGVVVLTSGKSGLDGAVTVMKLSFKGQLSHLKTKEDAAVLSEALSYGSLEEELLVLTTSLKFGALKGGSLEVQPQMGHQSTLPRAADAMKCFLKETDGICILGIDNSNSVDELSFEVVTFKPVILPQVDNALAQSTEWDVQQKRIVEKLDDMSTRFDDLKDSTKKYLGSGGPVTAKWTLGSVSDVSSITLSSGSENINSIKIITENSDGVKSAAVEYKNSLKVDIPGVRSSLADLKVNLGLANNDLLKAIDTSTLGVQTIDGLNTESVESGKFYFKGEDMEVESLEGGSTETVDSLLANLYTKSLNPALSGLKTFDGEVRLMNLNTAQVVEGAESIVPASLLKTRGTQTVAKSQEFVKASVKDLKLGDAAISDDVSASVKAEDLVIPLSELSGDFKFNNDIYAPAITSEVKVGSMVLSQVEFDNILRKSDDPLSIEGTFKVTMLESADSIGKSLNVKDGVVNGLSLKEINDNAVLTHCVNCEERVDSITGKITFEGDLSLQTNLKAAKINSLDFADYLQKKDFIEDGFSDATKKVFANTVSADAFTAVTFNSLNLNQIMTKDTAQYIEGKNTFNEKVSFKEINGGDEDGTAADGDHPTLDGINFHKKFSSDLFHIDANWVQDKTLSSEIEFIELIMGVVSTVELSDKVNAMDVPEVLRKIVQTTETEVKLTTSKTFAKAVKLENVVSSKINKGDDDYTTVDFSNTVDTTQLLGKKTFSKPVTFNKIFLHKEALVNNIDFAKMLYCWIDLGDKNSDIIEISKPIHFTEVFTPILNIGKTPFCFACPSSTFPDVTIDQSNIRSNVAAFTQLPESLYKADMTVEEGVSIMVNYRIKNESNLKLREIGLVGLSKEDPLEDQVNGLRALLVAYNSLNAGALDNMDAIELLRYSCRDPHLNKLDPANDVALLDGKNMFCVGGSCIQSFKKGFKTKTLEVTDSITISNSNPTSLVFGHNIITLGDERVSLSSDQTLKGDYTIAEASIGDGQTTGTFDGKLIVIKDQEDVSSCHYKSRFLDTACNENGNAQTFTKARKVESIDTTTFVAGSTGTLKVIDAAFDLQDLKSRGYQLDAANTFDSATWKGEVVLKTDTTVTGTVDGVDIGQLAGDTILKGPSLVNAGVKITGNDENSIDLSGKKTLLQAPSVRNLLSMKSGDLVYPNLVFRPCTRGEEINKVLLGDQIEKAQNVVSVEVCHEKCRTTACVAMMYQTSIQTCTIFSSFIGWKDSATLEERLDAASFLYLCTFHMAWTNEGGTERYLAVDDTKDTPVLTISDVKEKWIFRNSMQICIRTGLAISGTSGMVAPYDVNDASQKIQYKSDITEKVKIANPSGQELDFSGSNFDFSWVDIATKAKFSMFTENGMEFDSLKDGQFVSRVLRKSGAQDVSGTMSVLGDVAMSSGTVTSSYVGDLGVANVAASYNYDTQENKHVVKKDYTISSAGLTSTTLTAATVGDRTFATFVADTIDKSSTNEETISGAKIFSTELVLNKDLSVTGSTGGRNLDAAYADTVFVDAAATLAALSTFKADVVVDTGVADASVDSEIYKDLESQVQLALSDSVITYEDVADVDLTAVLENTILKADVGPTTLAGQVVFKKDVSTADLTTGTLGLTSANNNVQIPADILQITSADVITTISDKTRRFSSIDAKKIVLNGQMYGKEANDFLTVLYKDGEQTITGSKGLTGDTSMTRDFVTGDRVIRSPGSSDTGVGTVLRDENFLEVYVAWPNEETWTYRSGLVFAPGYGPAVTVSGMVNDLKLASNLVFLAADGSLDNDVGFNTLSVKKLKVEGDWDGVNFDTMSSNVLELSTEQTISHKLTIKSPVEFEKKIVGNEDETDGKGVINNQKVIDLLAIDSVYSNVKAVKTSAQAEANTLCKYAIDLQESYLASQAIDDLVDVARDTVDFAAPRGSKIFKFASFTKLAVVADGDLYIYDIKQNAVKLDHKASLAGTELLFVADVPSEEGVAVHIYLRKASGTLVFFLLSGNGEGLQLKLEQAGAELPISDFTVLNQDLSFSLTRLSDDDGYFSRISKVDVEGRDPVVWTDSLTIPEVDRPRMDVVHAGVSSELVFAITVPMDNADGDFVRIVHIQPKVIGESVTYVEKWSVVLDVSGPDFVLQNINWKLFLFSAGEFGIQVDEIDLENQEVVRFGPNIKGAFSGLSRHPSFVKESSTIIAVQDEYKVAFVDYFGVDGFKVSNPAILWTEYLQSVSVMTYIENEVSVYKMSLVGTKGLAVFQGTLAKPVSRQQITCPEPEVVPLVSSADWA